MSGEAYSTLKVTNPREYVFQVELNRPEKRNAMNTAFWVFQRLCIYIISYFSEILRCFERLSREENCRAIVLSGAGKIFTAGLDLSGLDSFNPEKNDAKLDVGRRAFKMREHLLELQKSFKAIEKCNKPVIAAIHNACVGAGVDMTSACDIRYCSKDAWFQIKEVDLGLTADVGTLQWFPKVIGNDSMARELALTARKFTAEEAKQIGFVSRILADRASLITAALDTASLIASKSPIAVQGTKVSMVYSRDHTVSEGLEHIAIWSQGMQQTVDKSVAAQAVRTKSEPKFSKL